MLTNWEVCFCFLFWIVFICFVFIQTIVVHGSHNWFTVNDVSGTWHKSCSLELEVCSRNPLLQVTWLPFKVLLLALASAVTYPYHIPLYSCPVSQYKETKSFFLPTETKSGDGEMVRHTKVLATQAWWTKFHLWDPWRVVERDSPPPLHKVVLWPFHICLPTHLHIIKKWKERPSWNILKWEAFQKDTGRKVSSSWRKSDS